MMIEYKTLKENGRYIIGTNGWMWWIGDKPEVVFGDMLGLSYDWTLKPGGDGRVDYVCGEHTIDVKGARKPFNLLREAGAKHADILVLAGWDESEPMSAWFLGWQLDSVMVDMPSKNFGYGIINHFQHYTRLNTMATLIAMLSPHGGAG